LSQRIDAATTNNSEYLDWLTKIPSFSDQADVVEAFKLYHYGRDNYDGSLAPASDSIYGHLNSLDTRINVIEDTPTGGGVVTNDVPLELVIEGSDQTAIPEGLLWVDKDGLVISSNISSTAVFTNSQPDEVGHGLLWVDKDANVPFLNVSTYATNELVNALDIEVANLSASFATLPSDIFSSSFFKFINHGTNNSVIREGAPIISWKGEITPLNVQNADFWYRDIKKVGVVSVLTSTPNANPELGTVTFSTGNVVHGLSAGNKVRLFGVTNDGWTTDPNRDEDYEISSVTTGILLGNTFTITGLSITLDEGESFPITLTTSEVTRQSNLDDVGRLQDDTLYAYVDSQWKEFAFRGEFVDPLEQPTVKRWSVIGENGQTSLFGVDLDGEELTYVAPNNSTSAAYLQVFLDGQLLSASAYTASGGFAVELGTPLSGGEVVEIFAYGVFNYSTDSFEDYNTSENNIIAQRFFSYV
jgi:hypothetical protein